MHLCVSLCVCVCGGGGGGGGLCYIYICCLDKLLCMSSCHHLWISGFVAVDWVVEP